MSPKQQLAKMVGDDLANKWIQMVKNGMQETTKEEIKVKVEA